MFNSHTELTDRGHAFLKVLHRSAYQRQGKDEQKPPGTLPWVLAVRSLDFRHAEQEPNAYAGPSWTLRGYDQKCVVLLSGSTSGPFDNKAHRIAGVPENLF